MKKHCWGNLVSRFRALETFFAETFFCVQAAKKTNVSELFQEHFVAAPNVSCAHKRFRVRVRVSETFYAMFPFKLDIGQRQKINNGN